MLGYVVDQTQINKYIQNVVIGVDHEVYDIVSLYFLKKLRIGSMTNSRPQSLPNGHSEKNAQKIQCELDVLIIEWIYIYNGIL